MKGLSHCSWGMKNRLSRIFRPSSGNTVMLAFDHGYIMGSTSGLERLDIVIEPLLPFVDVLMATRGALRSCVSPSTDKPLCIRATHDASVLHEDMSVGGGAGLDMEDALRMNASALAVQTFIGAPGEGDSLELLCRAVDQGERYGIPVLGVVAGKAACPERQVLPAGDPNPGGARGPHGEDLLLRGLRADRGGVPRPHRHRRGQKASRTRRYGVPGRPGGRPGVDMGRNIFQSEHPAAMAMAVGESGARRIHGQGGPYEAYLEMKNRS